MNCPICGADNREGAHFCRMCGVKLPATTVPGAPPAVETEKVLLDEPVSGVGTVTEPPEGAATEEAPPERYGAEADTEKPGVEAESAGAPPTEPVTEGDFAETPEAETGRVIEPPLLDPALRHTEGPSSEVEAEGAKVLADEPAVEATAGMEEKTTEENGNGGAEEEVADRPKAQVAAEVATDVAASQPDESESLTPARLGTVIADRYALVEVVDARESEILYRADDLRRCWQCGFEDNVPDDTFCGQCGAAMEKRPSVHLLESTEPEARPPDGLAVTDRLAHRDHIFLLLGEEEQESEAAGVLEGLRLQVGHRSDVGQVRELNEDSLLVMTLAPTYEARTGPVLGLFTVADGMGGHEGGEVASRLALQVLAHSVLEDIILPELADQPVSEEAIIDRLRDATTTANDAVFLARQKRENDMGTTVTTALVRDHQLFLAHVGDCRAYLWNGDGLRQLTSDHSLVASMIASGQAQPEEIYTHPHRSVIYRCIGDQPVVEVDTGTLSLAPGDRLIICSDGLWEMVRNEGIEDVMLREADPQAACELLVSHANLAGGDDNISVIIIQVAAV
jgi:serine/threonine protein phosphatase PrpC